MIRPNQSDSIIVSVNDDGNYFDEVGDTGLSLRTLLINRRADGRSLDGWFVELAGDRGWIVSRRRSA